MAFTITLGELAREVGGNIVRGEPAFVISGMAALDAAGPFDVSFLGNAKYRPQFLTTEAGAAIVPEGENGGPESCAVIAVSNPSLAFATVVRMFGRPPKPFAAGVHPRAFVHETAKLDPQKVSIAPGAVISAGVEIGDGTTIAANVVIEDDVIIGRDCLIHANVSIREGCKLGDRVMIQPGAVIGSDGYGYEFTEGHHKKIEQVGIVELHDDVEIGANTTIDRARFGKTVIGEGTKIDNLVQIAHNVVIGKHCLIVAQTGIAGSAKLGNYVTIAAQAGVAGHILIGDKAVCAARTGASKNLEGGKTYLGSPAQEFHIEQKMRASFRSLPKLVGEVKALRKRLDEA